MTVSRGIYLIHNAGVSVAMDLYGGTKITGWKFSDTTINWNQLWLVEPVNGKADTFTVRSIISGTYMTLSEGNPASGTPIFGYHKTDNTNQEWIIKHSADEELRIGNIFPELIVLLAFAALFKGDPSNGTPINGWKNASGFDDTQLHQCWFFRRMSLSSAVIKTIIGENACLAHKYETYLVDRDSTLPNMKWRQQIFDADDFALVMKAAVAQWGADKFRADGFAIFCGLMLGNSQTNPSEAHAYNFTVSDDHSKVVFFEPLNKKFMDDELLLSMARNYCVEYIACTKPEQTFIQLIDTQMALGQADKIAGQPQNIQGRYFDVKRWSNLNDSAVLDRGQGETTLLDGATG
ncbi:hypothetical protein EDD18DRAFT_1107627 [Armillaria luteobubalina]|uniref:Ricin B lectin domain-containing protein n=1 Tax=Armillaria luteobubalina TaxID=153913 RepID=A0AA39Q0S1_9AGAR|nr:hypothetical protein EDD18DRAFT_1107627 [Armillaria luteobubalina]